MVFFRTHFRTHYLRFILARNYKGFVVDMGSSYQANLHFSQELQCFCGGHGFCETVRSEPDRSQIGIRCSGTQKCSQRFEIDHFCSCFFSAIQSVEILSSSWTYGATGVSLAPQLEGIPSQCMLSWCLTKAFVATMLLMIYPYGSTTKCKDNIISMAIRSNFVVIVVPLWVDHKM